MATNNKNDKTVSYDPNAAADPQAGIFGLPYSFEEAAVVYLPVPWEATTSYGGGTAYGPEAIINASVQMDVFDLDVKNPYLAGLHALPISPEIFELNRRSKILAQTIIEAYGDISDSPELQKNLALVNSHSKSLNEFVCEEITAILKAEKIPALIGGDHSTPFGAFQAAAVIYPEFGILHFDAHSDTRKAYLGFEHSHASIMYNAATQISQIKKIVQVGIRDFCEEEFQFTSAQKDKFNIFYDHWLSVQKMEGVPFAQTSEKIVSNLPDHVWVSFDIDGLDPRYCPHTGTPVPGGLDYHEAIQIIRTLARKGKTIIGFDVVEVAPALDAAGAPIEINQANDEWDANVGMRLIYKLSALALASQRKCDWNTITD
jgi:agmatinase